jgi:hypothetical protein
MWFRRSNIKKDEEIEPEPARSRSARDSSIDQGVYYLYMIIGLQVLLVFGIMGIIMLVGKVISTPGWVFLLIFALFATSIVYIYRKAKRKFRRLKEFFGKAGRNYEISIMGGMLTMRIEQDPNAPKLLDAPFSVNPEQPVIDAETQEDGPAGKLSRLS